MALTWPLAPQVAVALPALGDSQQQAWILAWNAHALRTNPAAVWQAPIFFPYPDTLAYHDHHLVLSLVGAPLIWLTGNPVLAHNVLVLLSLVLTGWAVYHLALDTTGRRWPAFVGGAAFAFCSYQLSHLPQLNLLQTAWLPWALLFLRRLLRPAPAGGRTRDALLFGLFTALQCVNAFYYGFFSAAVLGGYAGLWAVWTLWARLRHGRPLPWATAARLALGGALAALAVVPVMLPYLRLYQTLGIVRTVRELDNWSAPLRAYASALRGNLLNRTLGWPLAETGEMVLFPGLLVALLGVAALVRRPDREKLFWGLVAVAAVVLSFGTGIRLERNAAPLPVPLPYITLYTAVPGFGSMRVPARWGMLVALALAVLAAITLGMLLDRLRGRWQSVVGVAVLGVVLLEQASVPLDLPDPTLLQQVPAVYRWLGAPEQRDIQVVLELPVGPIPRGAELSRITWRHYYSLYHWKALPVAYGALIPFGTTDLLGRVQRLPEPDALRYLQFVGVDTLLVHHDQLSADRRERLLSGLDASPLLRRRADVEGVSVYTLAPAAELTSLSAEAPPGASVFVSADERVPGLLALALTRRWRAEGLTLYGPGRLRYYAPLDSPRPGQVFTYGLLAADEDPVAHGFSRDGLRWRTNGLALYRADPGLRANVALGRPVSGAFHPVYPPAVDITLQPDRLQAGAVSATWSEPVATAAVELDVASLTEQTLLVGTTPYALPAGATTITAPLPLGQTVRVAGADAATALQRVRVRTSADGPPTRPSPAALVAAAAVEFSGARLKVAAQAAGAGTLLLEVRGAAAYDDRPVKLLAGGQPVAPAGGPLTFEVDLLRPAAPWLSSSEPPVDGRYIAYLRDASQPGATGVPVAKFNIRNGALADPEPVPLPLSLIQ